MGHLFVTRGDLTKLACDGLLIPCDSELNVNSVWADVLPAGLSRYQHNPAWLVLELQKNDAGVVELPAVDGRAVRAFVTVDLERDATPELVVDRAWTALQHMAGEVAAREGRAEPLIGVPLPGTGHGGLGTRRAEVVDKLLERHRSAPLNADVALVLSDRRDFAALQERRHKGDWGGDLTDELVAHADRLGALAGQGELSLFFGAGLSAPVGLPSWWRLLDILAAEAGVNLPSGEYDPYRAAGPIVEKLGNRFHEIVRRELNHRLHAVGHALLASLSVKRMVTTNFDCCMETALKSHSGKHVRVLTREMPVGGSAWLLKINGDIDHPGSIVLTERALQRYPDERRALEGVVQSLLLTSHLLFVGFSLTDNNFLAMAEAVSNVRRRAHTPAPSKPGTALALTAEESQRAGYTDLHMLTMDAQSSTKGARVLEIFLDRLVWAASRQSHLANEYLLDDRYASGLSERDLALRDLLVDMTERATPQAKSSGGWTRLADFLRSLGADDELVRGVKSD